MNGSSINFEEKKVKKSDFYNNVKPFHIDDIDVNKILVSKREPYSKKDGLKYFIGYNDNDIIRSLCLRLPKMTGYINKFTEDKKTKITLSLRVNNNQI